MIERLDRLPQTDVSQRAVARRREETQASFERWLVSNRSGHGTGQADAAPADEFRPFAATPSADVVQVELHLQDAHGPAQIVSVPWRLSATGRLSQAASHFFALTGDSHALATVGAYSAPAVPPAAASILGAVAANGQGLVANAAAIAQVAAASRMADTERPISAPQSPATAAAPVAAAWTPRLLRWLERDGHDPAVWIRDYGLDEADARQIADAIRSLARGQGLRLERIVVNAREIWRAPARPVQEETV